jgi:hypothetical protein
MPIFGARYPEVTELFCRIPLVLFPQNTLVYSTNLPTAVFSTIYYNYFQVLWMLIKFHNLKKVRITF